MLHETTTPQQLALLLGTTYGKIIHFYYKKSKSDYYTEFNIPKKSGGKRKICAPEPQLLNLQSKLAKLLEPLYKPKAPVKAFIKGSSISKNAGPHVRKSYVFNIDIEDFFPSITFSRVRGLLSQAPYNLQNNTATVIAHLVTVDGKLPQGAPTSPILSNMICRRLDNELLSLAVKNRCSYTRYADDITFSFRGGLETLPSDIVSVNNDNGKRLGEEPGAALLDIITKNRFQLNPSKTRLLGKNDRQVVTGLIVNKKINVDRRFVRKTRALIHSIEYYGVEEARSIFVRKNPEKPASLENHIFGRLLFIKQIKGIESSVYHNMAIRFNNLPMEQKLPVFDKKTILYPLSKAQGHQINNRCWIIEVGLETEKDYLCLQGSGFFIEGSRLVTCAHLFSKIISGSVVEDFHEVSVVAFRAHEKGKKLEFRLDKIDTRLDIAILKVATPFNTQDATLKSDYFSLEFETPPDIGETVSVLGFPDAKMGTSQVGRFWSKVTNFYPISGVTHYEIDKEIKEGNSGGPVLNSAFKVIGIAAKGPGGGNVSSSFISIKHLLEI